MTALWPWLALAGLGMFHGINPAMGWLFAVALGVHRHSRLVVVLSLAPMALGHALSISVVIAAVMLLGVVVDHRMVRMAAGVILIAWAIYHWRYGHRHRVRVGMRTGFAGLTLWSFLMATGRWPDASAGTDATAHAPRPRTGRAWAPHRGRGLTLDLDRRCRCAHLGDAACHRLGGRHYV
jgi:hypothetical protein